MHKGLGVLPPAASLANVPLIGQGATLGHQRAGSGVPVTVAGAKYAISSGMAVGLAGPRTLTYVAKHRVHVLMSVTLRD